MERPEFVRRLNLSLPENKAKVRQFFAIVVGDYDIKAVPASEKHSDPQRRYYFGECVQNLMDYLNQGHAHLYTKDQCHEILAKDCLPLVDVVDPVTGEVIDTVRSSIKKLNKVQMGEFIDRVRSHLSDWNIPTDEPDRNWRLAKDRKRKPQTVGASAEEEW